jgi:hypothetical protein
MGQRVEGLGQWASTWVGTSCHSRQRAASGPWHPLLYRLAPVHAHRATSSRSGTWASEALALCEQTGNVPVASRVLSVLGSPHRHW